MWNNGVELKTLMKDMQNFHRLPAAKQVFKFRYKVYITNQGLHPHQKRETQIAVVWVCFRFPPIPEDLLLQAFEVSPALVLMHSQVLL